MYLVQESVIWQGSVETACLRSTWRRVKTTATFIFLRDFVILLEFSELSSSLFPLVSAGMTLELTIE